MPDIAFLGMRATSDFTTPGQRPKNWREMILRLYPNGKAPLTALTALMKTESTDDPEYNWFCKVLPTQAGTVTGMYTNADLTASVASTLQSGRQVFIKMSEADARQFIPSHTILLRNDIDPAFDTVAIIEEVEINGANSYLATRLLENSNGIPSTANINRVLIIGTANPEGALIGRAVAYDPFKVHNYTQIFRNALEITRTAKHTKLRTGPAYNEAKRECLELHSIEMEKAFLFGVPSENVGANGKPLRTTGGIIWAIKNFGGIVDTFPITASWENEGLEWLDNIFMQMFRYGETDKLAFVGDAALMRINQLVRKYGQWNYTPSTHSFGINVTNLVTPFGSLTMKTHPLFSHEPTNQNSMLIFEPKNIKYRYITDTKFRSDDEHHGHNSYDGQKEEYLTEAGMEFHFPQSWAWLNGVGLGRP